MTTVGISKRRAKYLNVLYRHYYKKPLDLCNVNMTEFEKIRQNWKHEINQAVTQNLSASQFEKKYKLRMLLTPIDYP